MSPLLLQELTTDMILSRRSDTFIKWFLAVDLSVLCISIYFTRPYDKNLFLLTSILSLIVLLVWCHINYKHLNPLPLSLTIGSLVFILFIAVSAILSQNQKLALIYLVQLRFIILSRLLYNAPLPDQLRKNIIIIFFLSAAVAGLVGIVQYFGIIRIVGDRPYGFSEHPTTYSLILTVVCCTSIIMLFVPKANIFTSKKGLYFLLMVILLTFYSAILSKTRGVWAALLIAPFITILLHDRRKAIMYLLTFVALFSAVALSSTVIKKRNDMASWSNLPVRNEFTQRAYTIVTSSSTEDVTGSTGNRLELWKGALLIFKEHPLLGCGLGDYELKIEELKSVNKINPQTCCSIHSHNIYLQALATGGILGLSLIVALFIFVIWWGIKSIRDQGGIGGYAIILITIVYMVVGLTYSPHGDSMYMAASCLIVGLIGPYGTEKTTSVLDEGFKPLIS